MKNNTFEVPVTDHPNLPAEVPLVASFHDDRNRLSYYHPLLREINGLRTPITKFFQVEGGAESFLDCEYRTITQFMQDIGVTEAFLRGDYSSGKYDGESGSKIESQDSYDIEGTVLEMFRQLSRGKRHIGGRVAIREWIPHDVEVRYYLRDGIVDYRDTLDDVSENEFPDAMANVAAKTFDTFAWSLDFIRHETTGKWYAIDMGLDGLYHDGSEWVAISEHLDESQSPQMYDVAMPDPSRFQYHR